MPDFVCQHCAAPFHRRGTKPAKFCSRKCQGAARPPSTFDFAEWYRANREDQNAKRRAWAEANPEKRKAIRAKWAGKNREMLRLNAAARRDGASAVDIVAILKAANGHCTYCGKVSERLEVDHVDPIALGGGNDAGNLVACCRSCNAKKNKRPVDDWLANAFGVAGLARAVVMLERREFERALYPTVKIVEVR